MPSRLAGPAGALLLACPLLAQVQVGGSQPVGGAAPRVPLEPPSPEVTRASRPLSGGESDGESFHPSISAGGRWVVFESDATNLGPPDGNGQRDIYVLDRDADGDGLFDEPGATAFLIASSDTNGVPGNGNSYDPSISADGRHVCFLSSATNLNPFDLNGERDIFVHDRDVDGNGVLDEPGNSFTIIVSIASNGTLADAGSTLPRISADGRHVAFESVATNLSPLDLNGVQDVYLHDRDPDGNGLFDEGNGVTLLVSANPGGFAGDSSSWNPNVSADGRFVAFDSLASDLVPDGNGLFDVFVLDRDPDGNGVLDEGNAVLTRVSEGPGSLEADGDSRRPGIAPDGRHVVFESDASDLGPLDLNGSRDVYALDRDPDGNGVLDEGNQVLSLMNVTYQGNPTYKPNAFARIAADGRRVAWVSLAKNLLPGDENNDFDVFARDRDPDGDGLLDQGNGVLLFVSSNALRQGGDELSGNGELTQDGRWMAFASDATNLVTTPDTNGLRDIYVRRLY